MSGRGIVTLRRACGPFGCSVGKGMKKISYHGYRFPPEIIQPQEEIIGHNCRFLQGKDRDQEGLPKLREAIKNHQHIEVTLRNFRKNGDLFYNKLNITPLFDNHGQLIYFLGVQYDVTEQVRAEDEINKLNAKRQTLKTALTR
jgi:hypothetical protein